MTFQGDPYRTLGIAPGASLNEIRSAYRRLAKQYHPDAAGERALPRFLAIQSAYERLVDAEGRLRPPGGRGTAPSRGGRSPGGRAAGSDGDGSEAWRADQARARASRDAWRARRAGSGGTAGFRTSPGPGARADAGATGRSREPGATGSRPGGERHHARRGPRRATPGSTTYDDAAETPRDPEWNGGAWYGGSSGTYWTINPREYADPRKHGPEYLARARRGATGGDERAGGATAAAGPDTGAPGTEAEDDEGAWAWTSGGPTTTDAGSAEWGTRSWTFDTRDPGPTWTSRDTPPRRPGWERRPDAAPDDAPPLPDLETLVRRAFPEHLLALARRPDRRWRLLLALIAWPPVGYGLAGLVSAATGCARFSASCPEPVPALLLLVQPALLALLFALPVVTAVAAFASLAAVAMALPVGAVLSVGALPRPAVEPTVLGIIVATTYAIAFVAAAVRLWGRPPPEDGEA